MTPVDLAAAWVALDDSSPEQENLTLAPIDLTIEAGRLYAGVDTARRLHLLVPVRPGEPVELDRRSRGVVIERWELVVDGQRRPYIDVRCEDRSLSEEFRRLTADMAARIEAEPSSANRICHQVLGRWRELLHGRRPALGPEALTGLFGELHALHQVVERDPARRIELWTGPTGAPHDLTTPSAELEVKATRRREGRFVEIHGLDQLQPPEDGTLHLLYLRVEERDQGRTVSDLVESLRSLGVDSSRLDQLLDQSGWSEDEPDDDRLAIVEERMYLVDDSFPKIVPQSFVGGAPPDGVMQLRYTVDLTGPVPRCLQTRDHEFVLQRLASIP